MNRNFIYKPAVWLATRELRGRRADFYFDLAMSLDDRVPIYSSLRKYEARARSRNTAQAIMYRRILTGATKGSLATALAGIVPPSELVMLDAAQVSGDVSVAGGLRFLAETVEKTDRMTEAIRKAVTYPAMLLLMFCAILYGFASYAVPILAAVMPVEKWPSQGKALYAVSTFITGYGLYLFLGLAACFSLFIYSLGNWTGELRRRVDRFLPYSLYRDYTGAMLIVSISSLMRTGVSLRSAIERAVKFANPWTRWHLRRVLKRLSSQDAANFGAAFKTGLLSQELEDRVSDASERRDPVTAFVKIGVGSIDRIASSIDKSAARMNSAMLLICGLCLAAMMMAFMGTAQQLGSSIRSSVYQQSK